MAELAQHVESLPRKGNMSLKQHKNSCQWYNWKSPSNTMIVKTSRQAVTPNTFIKRLAGLEHRCKANLGDDAIVPPGEATTKNVFRFSQHDNRNRIKAPEKKTVALENRQSQSQNICNTLDWSRNIKDTEFKIMKSESHKINDNVFDSPAGIGNSVNRYDFRRFPRKHHENTEKCMINSLLSQELSGSEPVQKLVKRPLNSVSLFGYAVL